jgi:hypothetical protein
MFNNEELKNHIETSSSVQSTALILAEWNMNYSANLDKIGNYRYRPTSAVGQPYHTITNTYDPADTANNYIGATNSDTKIDGVYEDDGTPTAFLTEDKKAQLLYSLESCFDRFRPRSGINKLRYFDNRYTHFSNVDMARRPRYYIADKTNSFKYWTSYRKDAGVERGISYTKLGEYFIDDAAPFVVYKNEIPVNRVVIKMQTNVGDIDLGPFSNSFETFEDPFYGDQNKTVPAKWKVQYLSGTTWTDAINFNTADAVGIDGYVELAYGVLKPSALTGDFYFQGSLQPGHVLPETPPVGHAYLIKHNSITAGKLAIWNGTSYTEYDAEYGWYLKQESVNDKNGMATELVSSPSFTVGGKTTYREFSYIDGLRIVVEKMNVYDSCFDLIELSPRLVADISGRTESFSITKSMSDLGLDGLPVGQLIAGTGNMNIFDYDDAFNANNENSIIRKTLLAKFQIKFYDIISLPTGKNIFVPVKTLYSDIPPKQDALSRDIAVQMKDMMFFFDSMTAPKLLLENVSLTSAISILLDNIGFSNYIFKKLDGEKDIIIPHFFVGPDSTISEILQQLAISTQSAMYFDEDNNFVVVSKNYMLPNKESDRATDMTLLGTKDYQQNGVLRNDNTEATLANIVDISSYTNQIYNGGLIRYSNRSIQRSFGSLKQGSMLDNDRTWVYTPALLWEVSGSSITKAKNNETGTQSSYVLSAIPLSANLSSTPPTVSSGVVINNTMDFGQGIEWIARYNGYFFANGEVIRYDAVEYNVQGAGTVWINSVNEYQDYFSKLPFNGKMYPTGKVRIFSEPKYTIQNINGKDTAVISEGAVLKHGRGQFGTSISSHNSGLDSHWTNNTYIRGIKMKSKYLFGKAKFYNASNAYSADTTTINIPDASNVYPGYTVTLTGGTGKITKGTRVVSVTLATNAEDPDIVIIDKPLEEPLIKDYVDPVKGTTVNNLLRFEDVSYSENGLASLNSLHNATASQSSRTGIIKNFMSTEYIEEKEPSKLVPGTIQSSALVFKGPSFRNNIDGTDFISYIYKDLTNNKKNKLTHFGTRLRIIGSILSVDKSSGDAKQLPVGSSNYYEAIDKVNNRVDFMGGSAGIGIMVNPQNNNGYFLEIIALTETNVNNYTANGNIENIMLYKVAKQKDDLFDGTIQSTADAIPVKLWGATSEFLVDDGLFTGQSRQVNEQHPTVYDIAVEYEEVDENTRKFYIYLNNNLVGTAVDTEKIPEYGKTALFVRGGTKAMFENIYALGNNYSQNSSSIINTPVNAVFGDDEISFNEAFRKYAMSGIIQKTYMSHIGGREDPKYSMYFEEFGTIMREAAYFDVKYDKAYPALYAKMSPTFNSLKGYTVSGFMASPYDAEFLIFNNTDAALSLDSTSGNYLRIQGVTFTQQSQHDYTLDEYFSEVGDLTDIGPGGNDSIEQVVNQKQNYQDIKNSRTVYGKKEFSLDTTYIQDKDTAEDLMEWLVSKITKPRKSLGVEIFNTPILQLGDVAKIDYSVNDVEQLNNSRYVVYSIQHNRDASGPSMTVYLSEVV